MDPELRARAEACLEAAATALGLVDPRPAYRERLRQLREAHPEAFGRAIEHYEERVLPALTGTDPVTTWLEYGSFLGGLTAGGRLTAIDESGRAGPWTPPPRPHTLILFIPDDTAADILTAARPASLTAAQQAALDLLVHRRLS